MKAFVAVLCLAAVANAGLISAPAVLGQTVVARAPSLDSAVIKSDRIGGNFAYSVAESHAYTAHTPIIQHVATPVAVSYSAPQVIQHVQHVPQVVATRAVHTVAAPALLAPGIHTIAGTPAATVRVA